MFTKFNKIILGHARAELFRVMVAPEKSCFYTDAEGVRRGARRSLRQKDGDNIFIFYSFSFGAE